MSKKFKITLSSHTIRLFFEEKKDDFNKHFIDNRNKLNEAYRTDDTLKEHSIIGPPFTSREEVKVTLSSHANRRFFVKKRLLISTNILSITVTG